MARGEACASHPVERFFQCCLLGLAGSSLLALASSGTLDWYTIGFAAGGLGVRAWLFLKGSRWRPERSLLNRLTLTYAAFFLLDYFFLSRQPLAAVVHLVFFLATIKIIGASKERDYLVVAVLSFSGMVSAALLSLSFMFPVALTLYIACGVGVLTAAEIRRRMRKLAAAPYRAPWPAFSGRLAALSAGMALGISAITLAVFFLSPHGMGPVLGGALFHRVFLPGFSRQIRLGEIGRFKQSSRTVMHVRQYTKQDAVALKWRGGALTHFDGRDWSNPNLSQSRLYVENGRLDLVPSSARIPGRHLVYEVSFDALESDALFFAGLPEHIDLKSNYLLGDEAGGYRLEARAPRGFRYEVYSRLEDPAGTSPATLDAAERSHCLQLPPVDPRIPQLAAVLTSGAPNSWAAARALERGLRTGYAYSLEAPQAKVSDPLAYFLFQRKQGHCEYFASAMAVMLRTLGIPARVATGFQSGIYNDVTKLWLIRAGDAHAWVEAWIPGHGWTTFDPTPPDPQAMRAAFADRLALYADAAEGLWQEWVVGYDPNRQGSLMDRLQQEAARFGFGWFDSLTDVHSYWDGATGRRLRRFGPEITAVMLLGVLVWFAGPPLFRAMKVRRRVRMLKQGHAEAGDAVLLYRRMLRIVKRRGYQKPPWFTPAEFAGSLPDSQLGAAVIRFTESYNAWRYGGRMEEAPRMFAMLQEMEGLE